MRTITWGPHRPGQTTDAAPIPARLLSAVFVRVEMKLCAAVTAAWFGSAPMVALAAEPDDAKRLPSSISMKLGERRRYKNVGMAAISDSKTVKIAVEDQILTMTARKVGLCFLWVFPPDNKGGGADAITGALKRKVIIRVSP